MLDMIEALMDGDTKYLFALKEAKVFWAEFFSEHASDDDETLMKAIEAAQTSFQWAVEKSGLTAPFAKGIMALTCIASLYHDGFEDQDLAARAIKAMMDSKMLSTGIGSSAKEVAVLYGLPS